MDSSLSEVAHRALSLPVSDRIVLAQTLWDSLDEQDVATMAGDVAETLREASRRDAELSNDVRAGRSHDDVMAAVQQAIRCE